MGRTSDAFKQQLQAAFDALSIGQVFTFRRTFTDADVALFCGITGDYNPYHLDDVFVRDSWYGRRIIPGLLTGSMLTHIGGLLGFLSKEMHFEFMAPVFSGDTITCTVTIAEKNAETHTMLCAVHCTNEDGREVLRARFSGFPSQPRLAC